SRLGRVRWPIARVRSRERFYRRRPTPALSTSSFGPPQAACLRTGYCLFRGSPASRCPRCRRDGAPGVPATRRRGRDRRTAWRPGRAIGEARGGGEGGFGRLRGQPGTRSGVGRGGGRRRAKRPAGGEGGGA